MRIIISGGGTAGHIYPALAVADELRSRGAEILFVGATGRMEMTRVPMNGYNIVGLPVAGLQRSLKVSNLMIPFKLAASLWRARGVIKSFKPDVVVGFGGYASAPILKAAQKAGIPTVIQEQNSYAGLTNRMLAKDAKHICVAYHGMERFFDPSKITITGNPLRSTFTYLEAKMKSGYESFGFDPEKPTILVMGGSLGTRKLNDMMVEWAPKLPNDIQLIWQTGKYYEESLKSVEVGGNIVKVAFIERMDYAYSVADVVICRSGASTVSELELLGIPTIFVPSPNVAEDHQTQNAKSLTKYGAALMVEDSVAVEKAIPMALELLAKNNERTEMADKMKTLGKPYAAKDVADIVINTIR